MNAWTRNFLNSTGAPGSDNQTEKNAANAKKLIYLPEKLWLELSKYFPKSALRNSLSVFRGDVDSAIDSAFMAGVAIGWSEAMKED